MDFYEQHDPYELIVSRFVGFGNDEIYVRNEVLRWSLQERIIYMQNLISLGFCIDQ